MTPTPPDDAVRVDVHLGPDDIAAALRHDVAQGLTTTPKHLPPKWFYDDYGCELFDKITRLPEYYPTEREREILLREAPNIASLSGADTLVELGSGTSDKTRALLDAMDAGGHLVRFVAFEISESTLRAAGRQIAREYPTIRIHGVAGDFDHHLATIPRDGRRLLAFLGGTIGNYAPPERAVLLGDLAATMASGDHLLLGTDLVKDIDRLEQAYDDDAGITAEFNLNVLNVVNRELHADFELDNFEHVAFFDTENEWIEMRLRSRMAQTVTIGDLDLVVSFDEGEEMRTEISAKFRRQKVDDELAAAGLTLERWMTDDAGDFALSLSRKP
jgi:L-histidine N-alpha-methyltransferase